MKTEKVETLIRSHNPEICEGAANAGELVVTLPRCAYAAHHLGCVCVFKRLVLLEQTGSSFKMMIGKLIQRRGRRETFKGRFST